MTLPKLVSFNKAFSVRKYAFIFNKRLNVKDIIYYSVEKEQEREKRPPEDQTERIFKEKRSSGP